MSLCQCGCGQPVKPGSKFLQFHIAKVVVLARREYLPPTDITKRRRKETRQKRAEAQRALLPSVKPVPCACGCGGLTELARKTIRNYGHIKGQPLKFIHGHNGRKTTPEYNVSDNGCWHWQRRIASNGYGYGSVNRRPVPAHRLYYQKHKGPIPNGCEIDHVCHNVDFNCTGGSQCLHRRCVNPAHLEAVTHASNSRRGRGTRLTPQQVGQVKRMRLDERKGTREIAGMFNITPSYVSYLTSGMGKRFRVKR